ncbi:MAG: hypothetical protein CVU77_05180 [Elusimicrobia bacterium HGW-Elusimicrobia-1]|jgi:hypothetical protein|nr:MAG: hypothetical protein CVU77_05180 [Elusimicrobia bacterium HGW-Elusimicrobia-1]
MNKKTNLNRNRRRETLSNNAAASLVVSSLIAATIGAVGAMAILPSSVTASDFKFNLESRIYSNMISGSTEQAVLRDGLFHEENLKIGYFRKTDGGTSLKAGAAARLTSDSAVARRDFEIRNYFISAHDRSDKNSVIFGDSYVGFSKYTFSRNIEGIVGTLTFGHTAVIPVYGRTAKGENNVSYARTAQGARIESSFAERLKIGANYVSSSDDKSSVTDDTSIFAREENTVSGFDGTFGTGRFTFEGEFASSDYKDQKSAKREGDTAWRIKTIYRKPALRAEGEYEVVGSSFNTLAGWAARDRAVTKTRMLWNTSPWLDTDLSYEILRNNLNGALAYTESAAIPKIAFTIAPSGKTNFFLSHSVRTSYSDDIPKTLNRDVATTGAGINLICGQWRPAVTLETNNTRDHAAPINNFNNTYADISLRAGFETAGAWKLLPTIGWRATSDKYDANPAEDTATTLTIRALARSPGNVEIAGFYTGTRTDRRSSATVLNRRNLGGEALLKLADAGDKTLSMSYNSSDYEQTAASGITTSYGEKIIETRLRMKF